MNDLIFALKSGIIAAAATGAGQLVEDHFISLPTLCAVGAVVLPAAWWLSSRLTKQDDAMAALKTQVDRLEKAVEGKK